MTKGQRQFVEGVKLPIRLKPKTALFCCQPKCFSYYKSLNNLWEIAKTQFVEILQNKGTFCDGNKRICIQWNSRNARQRDGSTSQIQPQILNNKMAN